MHLKPGIVNHHESHRVILQKAKRSKNAAGQVGGYFKIQNANLREPFSILSFAF
jgi:hypothetical protein